MGHMKITPSLPHSHTYFCVVRFIVNLGTIWWGTRGMCPPTFFFLGFVFGEVSKPNVAFVLSCFVLRIFHVRSWAQFGGGRVPPLFEVGGT